MRSRLEAGFARFMDGKGVRWTYEPKAFASEAGQYLPDFEVHGMSMPQFIEVKASGRGTPDVLERMKIILASIPEAALFVMEGAWSEGEYWFNRTQCWPELETLWVYVVWGCDSWHSLSAGESYEPGCPQSYRSAAEEIVPHLQCADEPRVYVLPDECRPFGLRVWAVDFHKGDATIVSPVPLPWLARFLVGSTQRPVEQA